jgi:DNA (cytosine-5)-methyltransferase 1
MLGLALRVAIGGRIQTVAYVEREAYATAALVARMDDSGLDRAPVWDDVESICEPEFLGYVQGFHPVVVTAGYPCQPFSCAGKRGGVHDSRHLWPWIARFIGATKPECCFFENVPGHLRSGLDVVLRDLQDLGYRIAAGLFSAEEVGASQERERLFILGLADAEHGEWNAGSVDTRRAPRTRPGPREQKLAHATGKSIGAKQLDPARERPGAEAGYGSGLGTAGPELADATGARLASAKCGTGSGASFGSETGAPAAEFCAPLFAPGPDNLEGWRDALAGDASLEPAVCRVADGLAAGVVADRLRLIGNGVVPLVAAYAFISLCATLEV